MIRRLKSGSYVAKCNGLTGCDARTDPCGSREGAERGAKRKGWHIVHVYHRSTGEKLASGTTICPKCQAGMTLGHVLDMGEGAMGNYQQDPETKDENEQWQA